MTRQPALFPATHTTPPAPWTAALPGWLATTIDELQPSPQTDKCILAPCPRCGTLTLTGWDGPGQHHTDPTRLTNQQELACILTGRQTLTLHTNRAGITITRRDQWNTRTPAERTRDPVVPAHQCGHPIGTPIPWETLYPQPAQEGHPNDAPPF